MKLRPYQTEALAAIDAGWAQWQRQLVVLPTGAGKTILFARVARDWVDARKGKVLILAHREELVEQAIQKLHSAAGLFASKEKAQHRGSQLVEVVVGSVQTLAARLERWPIDHFKLIILDEAHHALSQQWQDVIGRFPNAKVLGVTATPDRADRKKLGSFFQNVAYEASILDLVRDGYLSQIRAKKLQVGIPLEVLRTRREYTGEEVDNALTPMLAEVARELAAETWDRKLLVFLPLRDTSERFARALASHGLDVRHVDGESADRFATLRWFAEPGPKALCNAMLLTEGFDQPDVDAICCLRPMKSQSLYAQSIGRGTRLAEGKDHLLILDPLWLTGEHDLCRPADIAAGGKEHSKALQARMLEGLPITEAEELAKRDVQAALEQRLKEAKKKPTPRGLVDPLVFGVSLGDGDLADWEPTLPWHELPPTPEQLEQLKGHSIHITENLKAGLAQAILDRVARRKALGLATPKQLQQLRRMKHPSPELLSAGAAGIYINQNLSRFRRR